MLSYNFVKNESVDVKSYHCKIICFNLSKKEVMGEEIDFLGYLEMARISTIVRNLSCRYGGRIEEEESE